MSRVGWLYTRYNVGVEWWDLFTLIRKLLLCGILLLFPNPSLQLPIAIVICLFTLINLNLNRPHKSKIVFRVAELASCAITIKYVGGLQLLAMVDEPDELKNDVGWWLVAIDCFVLVAAIVASALLVWNLILKNKTISDEDLENDEHSMLKIVPHSTIDSGLTKEEKRAARRRGRRETVSVVL